MSGGRFKQVGWWYSSVHHDSSVAVFQVRNNDIVIQLTINNASDYQTNGLYQTPNPNQSPLARLAISPIIRYPTVICSPLVRCINKCNRCHNHGASCSSLCNHINDPEGSRQHGCSILAPVRNTFSTLTLLVGWQERKLHGKLLCQSTTATNFSRLAWPG